MREPVGDEKIEAAINAGGGRGSLGAQPVEQFVGGDRPARLQQQKEYLPAQRRQASAGLVANRFGVGESWLGRLCRPLDGGLHDETLSQKRSRANDTLYQNELVLYIISGGEGEFDFRRRATPAESTPTEARRVPGRLYH
jgi:hypothetical protein